MVLPRLLWKFVLAYGLLFAIFAGTSIALLVRWQRDQMAAGAQAALHDLAMVARHEVEAAATPEAIRAVVGRLAAQSGGRFSVLGKEGEVLADSAEGGGPIPNQAEQSEIRAAAQTGRGMSLRVSPTSGEHTMFYAMQLDKPSHAGFVRVGLSWNENERWLRSFRNRLFILFGTTGAALIGLTVLLVTPVSQRFRAMTKSVQRMRRGDFGEAVHYEGNDEIAVLSRNLNEMREALSAHIDRLQKNSDRLAIVLGTMSEGVVALDNRKHILFANSAARVLLDFATPDPVGRPLLEAVRNRTVQQAVESAFSTDEPTTLEVELSSTVRRIVSIQARRLPGTPSPGVLVVLHDVSDLRRLENLRQEFVANVSHELKTPLTIIKAFAETLLDGAISDQEHNVSFVRQISEQAERLHQLILDLLSVARIESGDERFELDAIPIHGLITACVQRYKPAADVKEVQLTANSSDDGLQVMADEEAIREILDNLIDNAIKYTPSGGNVTIECRSQQSMVQIDVSDTGIGIPADLQNRIFERFYRVDKARSRELGGTGLGLSIVKHLVAAMGGTVAVRSELNRGSTFTVCLPRA
jgi:two-component system phosphate regulon sensor histidine kinase PhoR